MTFNPDSLVNSLVVAVVAWVAIRVTVARLEQWTKSHEALVNERHQENQRRLLALEESGRDATRSDMREAAKQMTAAAARFALKEE